jgi:hypothetical protein
MVHAADAFPHHSYHSYHRPMHRGTRRASPWHQPQPRFRAPPRREVVAQPVHTLEETDSSIVLLFGPSAYGFDVSLRDKGHTLSVHELKSTHRRRFTGAAYEKHFSLEPDLVQTSEITKEVVGDGKYTRVVIPKRRGRKPRVQSPPLIASTPAAAASESRTPKARLSKTEKLARLRRERQAASEQLDASVGGRGLHTRDEFNDYPHYKHDSAFDTESSKVRVQY